jgi:protein-tyrosine kinase
VTLSRYDQCRTILMDMDLRKPGLARYLGVRNAGSTGDFLRGLTTAPDYFTRLRGERLNIGSNLALGLNGTVEDYAAELFQQQTTGDVLAAMEQQFHPEVILFDLPPALAQDDVIAFRPHFDCILLVVGGGITTADEVREAQRRIGEDKPLLGIVLNKADVEGDYAY